MFEAGTVLGAYRIVRPLGHGGMGRVYEAEHVDLRVRRALKVFESGSKHADFLRKRFVAEGRILADLRHPRIVRVYDFAVDSGGTPYFAMDLVVSPTGEPRTLEDACRDGVDEDRVAAWFRDICEGLSYIHSKGVVHRDISLDNILLDGDGRPVLTDFGIAKIVGEAYRRQIDVTKTLPQRDGSCISWGKGLYMAPELRQGGEATFGSDAYSLGILLFRILAGSWYTPDVRLADVLAGCDAYNWAEIIARLCARDPGERLGADGIAGVAARLHGTSVPGRRWRRPIAAALALLLLAGVVAALLPRGAALRTEIPPVPRVVAVTNVIPQTVYHVVDVTNVVRQTVYEIVPVTNRVEVPK